MQKKDFISLDLLKKGQKAIVNDLNGEEHFISRATSIGFTPGAKLTMVSNRKRLPLLVFLRDTQIAIDRKEAERILIHEVE